MNFYSKILNLAVALVFFSSLISAQVSIRGKIQDSEGLPLIGAIVKSGNNGVSTDFDGNFLILLNLGQNIISVDFLGYEKFETSIIVNSSENPPLNIVLASANILLDVAEISSSRFEKPLAESPISLEVIKPRAAERLNSVTADQIIDKVPGVQIIDNQANIRGGSGYSYGAGTRVMLVMDDLPILQPDAAYTNWSDLPLENVGQIEIIKGAASALYGSAAMNGVIHFRNIKPTIKPFTSVSMSTRVYMKPKDKSHWWMNDNNHIIPSDNVITLAHRQKFKKLDLTLGSMYRNEVSFNKGKGVENFRINGSVVWHFSDRLIAGLGANVNTGHSSSFFYWDKQGSYLGSPSSYSNSKRTRFNIDPFVQYFSANNYRLKFMSRWLHIDNNNDNNQSNQSENLFNEFQVQKKFEQIGLEMSSGLVLNYSNIKAPLYSDTIFHSYNYSLYTQLEKTLIKNLKISGGMRYEFYKLKGPSIVNDSFVKTPIKDDRPVFRLGLNYQLIKGTFLRASFGQGFRFPSLAEKFINTAAGGFNVIPNVDLQSEYGNSKEIGIKQGIKYGRYQGFIDLAYFDSRYQDMIEFTLVVSKQFQFFYQAQNVGDVIIKGFEITNQGFLDFGNSKILYNAGVTLIDPKFQEFDSTGKDVALNQLDLATQAQRNAQASSANTNILKYRSKQLARMDLEYQWMQIFAGVNFTYASHVTAIDFLFENGAFINGVREFRKDHDHGYRLYDFRVGYQFNKLILQLNVQNAFNEVYTLRPGLMEAPRSIGGRVGYAF